MSCKACPGLKGLFYSMLSSQHLYLFPHDNLAHHGTLAAFSLQEHITVVRPGSWSSRISSQLYHWWIIGFKLPQSGLLDFSFSEAEKPFLRFFPISSWDEDVCKGWQFLQVSKKHQRKLCYVMLKHFFCCSWGEGASEGIWGISSHFQCLTELKHHH